MVKKFYMFLVLVLIFALGCIHQDYGVLDNRFMFRYKIYYGGEELILNFTDVPFSDAYLSEVEAEHYNNETEDIEFYNCNVLGGTRIEKNREITIKCDIPKDFKGELEYRFKITHSKPLTYKPSEGETCLKYTQGWNCETRGHVTVQIS